MKARVASTIGGWLSVALALAALNGCSSNPLGDDRISAQNLTVRGQVRLDSDADLEGVFVWLEGVNVGARTDAEGRFTLTVPPPASQSASGGLDGLFKLYYYVGNYGLKTSEVLLRKGAFLYGSGDLNRNGETRETTFLNRFLTISTRVNPTEIQKNTVVRIGVMVTLSAVRDTVTVLFPNSLGGLLGAIYIRNVDTGEVHILRGPPTTVVDRALVTPDGHSRTFLFDLLANPLPVGRYEIIPYVLVAHESVPVELFGGLGDNVDELLKEPTRVELLPAFLNIPFRRANAILEVTP